MGSNTPPPRLPPRSSSQVPKDLPAEPSQSYKPQSQSHSTVARRDSAPTSSRRGVPADVAPSSGTDFAFGAIIGMGGFGEVWEGIQCRLRRTIAIKRLRQDVLEQASRAAVRGRARHDMIRQFREEALTAAQLDHPNIVPVYDLGLAPDGTPLLAMKLVRGSPWDQIINRDWGRMGADEFLARHVPYLVNMAQAVAFAHSRGIAHRDLKPSQLMIGAYGETLLMDWGLAVNFDEDLLERTAGTIALGVTPTPEIAVNPAGTVSFMAPEQTLDTAHLIGPWTDVYLLGGTLYYILTGFTPHQGETSEEQFRAATMGAVARPEAIALGRPMPHELAELAMEAMQPDPADRIGSASEFVERLQDFLSGATRRVESQRIVAAVEKSMLTLRTDYRDFVDAITQLSHAQALWPGNLGVEPLREQVITEFSLLALRNGDLTLARVQAESKSPGMERDNLLAEVAEAEARVRRQRRVRSLLLRSTVFLLALVIGGGILYRWRAERSAAERFSLLRSSESALAALTRSRDVAEESRNRAERARADAEELLTFILDDLGARLEDMGRSDLLDRAAERAVGYLGRLPQENLTRDQALRIARAFRELGEVSLRRGSPDEAKGRFERALLLASPLQHDRDSPSAALEELAQIHLGLAAAHIQLGSRDEAQVRFLAARRAMEALIRISPESPAHRLLQASVLEREGELRAQIGEVGQSLDLHRYAIGLLEDLLIANPSNAEAAYAYALASLRIARLELLRGNPDAAERAAQAAIGAAARARTIAPEGPRDAASDAAHTVIALARLRLGDVEGAVAMAETAVARCREACRANPDSAAVRMELADALGALAEARHGRGETTSAIEAAAESFALLHDMAGRPFAGTATQAAAAGAAGRLAELESRAGRHDSATHHADLELSLRAAIAERTGSSSEAVAALQRARCRAGEVLLRAGQPDPAIGYAREAIDWARRTLRTASQDAAAQAVLGHGLLLRAEAEHARGRAREADAAAAEAVGVLRQLSEREGWPKDLVGLLARAYRAAGRPADAEALEGRHDPRQ